MQHIDVDSVEAVRQLVAERNIDHIKAGVFDMDGVLRGKYVSREKFLAALHSGLGFCDVVLGWDCNDQLYDNAAYTGWHTAYPDAGLRLLPQTCREIPFEPHTLFCLCEFSGAAENLCPRALLRRVLAYAEKLGYRAKAAAEFERLSEAIGSRAKSGSEPRTAAS